MLLKEGGTFVNAPEGQFRAVCVDFVDLGMVAETWDGEQKQSHKCRVVFQIDALMDDGKPYVASTRFTASLSDKANLRKFLESWRGKPFSADELKGFESENLIGVNALIQIVHAQKGDKTYANINSVMMLPKGMQKIPSSKDYVRVKDRPNENGGQPPHDDAPPPDDSDVPPF